MIRAGLHILSHFLVPAAVAPGLKRWLYPEWATWKVWAVLSATILVDLDHLLATPIYQADRCSLTTHPLHAPLAIVIYAMATVFPRTRLVAIGLLIHMGLDGIDCLMM